MKRNSFSDPLVLLTVASPNAGGHGSGAEDESIKPIPMSYEEWLQSRWIGEYDQNPGVDFEDYANWFASKDFGGNTWDSFNPGVVNENASK